MMEFLKLNQSRIKNYMGLSSKEKLPTTSDYLAVLVPAVQEKKKPAAKKKEDAPASDSLIIQAACSLKAAKGNLVMVEVNPAIRNLGRTDYQMIYRNCDGTQTPTLRLDGTSAESLELFLKDNYLFRISLLAL